MKLYSSSTSPFARKVRVVAAELGLSSRIEEIQVALSPVAPNADVSAKNPLGKIPALELETGEVLVDSRVICSYLDTLHSGRKLHPDDAAERATVSTTEALADGVVDAGILVRYELLLRPEALRWAPWLDGQCEKIVRGLAAMEARVPSFDEELDMGQIAIGCAIGWLEFREPLKASSVHTMTPRTAFSALYRLYDRLRERPSFRDTAPS